MESRVGPDMTEVWVLVQFRTLRVQNIYFELISRWFYMVSRGGAQRNFFFFQQKMQEFNQKTDLDPNIPENPEKSLKCSLTNRVNSMSDVSGVKKITPLK